VAPSGTTEHHGIISKSETWSADTTHLVTFGINIQSGATVTIAGCAKVQLQKGYSIVVEAGGALVAAGTAAKPVQLAPVDATQPWGSLVVFAPGTLQLSYTTVTGGGGETSNAQGMVEARGDQLAPAQEVLTLDHVALVNSANYGVSLHAGGALTKTSQALVISGSKKAPILAEPRLVSNIPAGTYTGNSEDAIVIATSAYGDVSLEDVTFHDRGVRYHVGDFYTFGRFVVGPKHVTLTIEPGVTMAFNSAGQLATKDDGVSTGVLVAKGTAAKPIIFTSAAPTPAPGDWAGLVFSAVADGANALDHVEVRFAGGPSQASGFHCEPDGSLGKEDSAVAIYAQGSAFITNSVFASSAGVGIDLAYTGDFVNMKATNTFTAIAGTCPVTRPRPKGAICPVAACP
jgi:hypothetical protein